MNEPIICTIITKKYLAHARTLAKTFLRHHPIGRVFVLLVDEIEGQYDPAAESFTTILARELNFPQLSAMLFRYTTFELICALKPYLLSYLFKEYNCRKICYFDSDITINHPLDDIFNLLDSNLVILTPHILNFLEDGLYPNDQAILQAGAYNAGFIGVAQHPELDRFLQWWQRKLEKHCMVDLTQGLLADQRWLDLMPSLFADVHILRDPSCNVAYWNLNDRCLEQTPTGYIVNGAPLKFFHFSGFSVEKMDSLSNYQSRYTLNNVPHLRPIFEQYRDCLFENGYQTVKNMSSVYEFFDNGVSIPNFARYLWRTIDNDGQRWPDPFNTQQKDSFINWLNAPAAGAGLQAPVTHLALEAFRHLPNLQEHFPDILGRDGLGFAQWFATHAREQLKLDDFFIEPVAAALVRAAKTPSDSAKEAAEKKNSTELYRERLNRGARLYLPIRNFLNRTGVGPRIKAVIGSEQVWKVRQLFFYGKISENNRYQPAYVSPRPVPKEVQPAVPLPQGLNVVGYLQDEMGVGEVARAILKALAHQNFPVAQVSVSNNESRANDTSTQHLPFGNPYAINLFNMNADAAAGLYEYFGRDFFQNRYNIGFWFWELAQFPEIWRNSFSYFDEIWVGSNFVQAAIALFAPIPVVNVRVPIIKPAPSPITRADLGLPPDKHMFLFVFDGLSYVERKNPLDLIRAYRAAFEPHFKETVLVIKATNLHRNPTVAQQLRAEIDSVGGVLIEDYLSRDELNGLFHLCDTYVSLHRSEGFGLTIAEAMSLAKPVIATAYSANMDFMTPANSYPVACRLVELEEDYGPYRKGNLWAAPDIGEAARLIKHLVAHPEEARQKGQLAQQDIEQFYGIEAVSDTIIKRLETIQTWR